MINILYKLWYGLAPSLWGTKFFYTKFIVACESILAYWYTIADSLINEEEFINKLFLAITIYKKEQALLLT